MPAKELSFTSDLTKRDGEGGYHQKISFLIYDDTKREAEAVPITPFHVNKQVNTVL